VEKQKIIFLFALLLLVSCTQKEEKKPRALPYWGNYDVIISEVGGEEKRDTLYPKIPAFRYLNQDSTWLESKSIKGKIWIANFFFTSCPSICPPMMSQLKRLNILTKDLHAELEFLSFTIDPKTDNPSQLKKYAEQNGLDLKHWNLLTGNEAKTHLLGVEHFMVHADKDPSAAGGFAHSDGIVLVDKEGYVRGIYNGTKTEQVDLLNKDLRKLLQIEYGHK
jgi:protein SCO1